MHIHRDIFLVLNFSFPGLREYFQILLTSFQFSSVTQSFDRLFATPWTAAHQVSLSINNSRSPPKLMSVESVMPSSHLILCHPLLLLPPSTVYKIRISVLGAMKKNKTCKVLNKAMRWWKGLYLSRDLVEMRKWATLISVEKSVPGRGRVWKLWDVMCWEHLWNSREIS